MSFAFLYVGMYLGVCLLLLYILAMLFMNEYNIMT